MKRIMILEQYSWKKEDVILDEIVVEVKNINKYDRMVYFVSDEAKES